MEPSVGLVHDYLLVMRGAERVFAAMAGAWPGAPVYTTLYDAHGTQERFVGRDVRTSPLQRLGSRQASFRHLLPLYPWAVGRLDVREHDVVLSSSSAFAHGVRPREDAVHLCYCHSPFRYAWHERETALGEVGAAARPALRGVLAAIRRWDVRASARVDRYVAISQLGRRRIAETWGRDAVVIPPPVEIERFAIGAAQEHVLVVGELVAHKRIDTILEAARRAGVTVRVVGEGPERARWATRFPEASFLGRLDDRALAAEYACARALVIANLEEFGITAVEAQAAGRPVVAPRAGGTGETVLDGTTGVLLDEVSVDTLAQALRYTDFDRMDSPAARRNAERFSVAAFQTALRREVGSLTGA
jgi:glycosyltransferase involved in cell wall biosynthesis